MTSTRCHACLNKSTAVVITQTNCKSGHWPVTFIDRQWSLSINAGWVCLCGSRQYQVDNRLPPDKTSRLTAFIICCVLICTLKIPRLHGDKASVKGMPATWQTVRTLSADAALHFIRAHNVHDETTNEIALRVATQLMYVFDKLSVTERYSLMKYGERPS
jgi:hypothetical protein